MPGNSTTVERSESRLAESLRTLPWDDSRYFRLARVEWTGTMVRATFLNGEIIGVSPERLLPKRHQDAAWDQLRLIDEAYVAVPLENGETEIPGTRIREATDPRFARYLEVADRFTAWEMGQKLKDLRQRAGLSGRELAARVGTTPQNISRIERGHNDIGISLVKRVLDALGASWSDLVQDANDFGAFTFFRVAQFSENPAEQLVRIETELLLGWPNSVEKVPETISKAELAIRSLPAEVRKPLCLRLFAWAPILLPGGPQTEDIPEHIRNIRTTIFSTRSGLAKPVDRASQPASLVVGTWIMEVGALARRLYFELVP